jgi:hypothetical protein
VFALEPQALFQTQLRGLTDINEIVAFYEEYRENILAEINELKPDRIIFSSEYIAEMSLDELKRLCSFVETLADEIIVFIYVRDPWSWSLSLRQEQIRTGWVKKETRVDYTILLRGLIEKIESAFDKRMTIAPFLEQPGGFDVVVDFCKRFGFESLIPAVQDNPKARPSMKLEATCIFLQLNQFYPVFDGNKKYIPDPARNLMSEIIQKSTFSKTQLRISKRTARKIYKESKADIEFVENNYFTGRKYFTDLYKKQQLPDFDDKISISALSPEYLTEYLLSCSYKIAERVINIQKNHQLLLTRMEGVKKTVQDLTVRLAEKEQRVQSLVTQAAEKEHMTQELSAELTEIKSSKAWKMALFLRKVRIFLVPANSWREKILKRLIS